MTDWVPSAVVGISFTTVGLLKIYGLSKGMVGGGCKPVSQRICGSCPSWSRSLNIGITVLFTAIGFGNLAYVAWVLLWRPPVTP